MRTRSVLTTLLLALALTVPMVGSATTPATAAPAAVAVTAPALDGASPGDGWYLTAVESYRRNGGQRLVLVAPSGATTTVLERRYTKWGAFTLLDWSTDGRTALLSSADRKGSFVLRVDVTTGTVVQQLRVDGLNTAMLDQAGTGIIATVFKGRYDSGLVLERIDWTGTRLLLQSNPNGVFLPLPGNRVLTSNPSGRKQYVFSTLDGSRISAFRPERKFCVPLRAWDQSRVLETCGARSDLVLIDPSSGARQRLTDEHRRNDYAHFDARLLADRLYVAVSGACRTHVGRLEADGSLSRIRIPGSRSSEFLIDAVGSELVVQTYQACRNDRSRPGLLRFDPVTRTATPLVTLGKKEDFSGVLVFGETRTASY